MKRLLIVLFAPLLLIGCASMNKSQCLNADWRMIGMEDGMRGRSPDYIGEHRRACAGHNVTPDLEEYTLGQNEGIRKFCTATKGFEMGQRGFQYNGVCPSDLEPAFLANYKYGHKIRLMANEIERSSSRLESDWNHLRDLKHDLKEKETQMIRQGKSEVDRILLLDEIKELQHKIDKLHESISREEEYRDVKKAEYEQLDKQAIY